MSTYYLPEGEVDLKLMTLLLELANVLLRQDLNENSIRSTITEMLESEKYKKNALRISKLMREKPFSAEERLVQWTNFAIANGVLTEFHLEGSRLNFIVYFNLDVAAVVIAVIVLSKTRMIIKNRYDSKRLDKCSKEIVLLT
ncbi:unnamed protein product [Cylicostephanus goldi]|uniref:glucuronosyltransferase n=1 Tax=Cylicostephanus goldi TaxID=71465 RepID=A0A3P7LWU4_CYLGO|nr:unnamed protein product [Cylicostephanus goldi]